MQFRGASSTLTTTIDPMETSVESVQAVFLCCPGYKEYVGYHDFHSAFDDPGSYDVLIENCWNTIKKHIFYDERSG